MVTLSTPLSHNSLSSPELSTKRHGCPLHQPMYLSESHVLLLLCVFFLITTADMFSSIEAASKRVPKFEESSSPFKELRTVACGLLAVCIVAIASPVIAANQRLLPLSTEHNRCERAFVGNTIGQANGVYDKPLDLRFCDYTNEKSKLKGKSVAAALMSDAKFDGADMFEAMMSKAYVVGASFKVLSGSTFDNAQLEDAVFEDTIIGDIDLQKLCTNTSISAEGRVELGCR
ncbi:hypothetical protein ES288_D07G127300v1 [Gossypium darwinii]|uniref:Uncharacterized protein n=1 Tax=Gossypium darwinii TaxID=34276 RepID=A0A5D2BV16_GOSDA|nr:hypothetical protein ES288_D07G127300v1 [Gossypium darwinii]